MLWFVDGSGGESHLRRFSRSWFSKMMREAQSQDERGQDSDLTDLSLDAGPPLLPSRLVHEA